ncbi:hypothetical protein ACGFNV_34065 [Streptomyces sp. NPDC048751]|uniref:hypothetical protein n=1 Tax=Streptomyces sp. NPDC048751 TaxID=3365591 RepID=UPI0037129D2B
METLSAPDILAAIAAGLGDWRKLAQPLAARYRVADLVIGAEFVRGDRGGGRPRPGS